MNIVFRADANSAIGTGHVMRCLALAQAWQDEGGVAIFAAAELPDLLATRLGVEGLTVEPIAAKRGSAEDADALSKYAKDAGADWVVIDGYCFGKQYQAQVKSSGPRLLVIDDHGQNQGYCADFILDQNVTAAHQVYADRPEYSRLLLGTRYALLRREFRRVSLRDIPSIANKLLITMGGSDPRQLTERVLRAVRWLDVSDLEIAVVSGPGKPPDSGSQPLSSVPMKVRTVSNPENMFALMDWADFAISAAGSTCWELCFAGLPALLIPVSDNQLPLADELNRREIAISLRPDQLDSQLQAILPDVLQNSKQRRRMSELGTQLVDGRGGERIAAILSDNVQLRRAVVQDAELLWKWANDSHARAMSFSSEPIPWERHCEWFDGKLNDPCSDVYLAMDRSGSPLGQVRFDVHGSRAELSISLSSEFRGRGLGRKVLLRAVEEVFQARSVVALDAFVKPQNSASLRLFADVGFRSFGAERFRGHEAIHFVMEKTGSSDV